MLKSIRFRPVLGVLVATMGVAALAFAADPPPGACEINDLAWTTGNGGCEDLATGGLVWSSNRSRSLALTSDWKYAMNDCANLVEGGYSDWRLPTVKECMQAGADSAVRPLRHLQRFDPDEPPEIQAAVWTSGYKANKAYAYSFMNDTYGLIPKGSGIQWYCVR